MLSPNQNGKTVIYTLRITKAPQKINMKLESATKGKEKQLGRRGQPSTHISERATTVWSIYHLTARAAIGTHLTISANDTAGPWGPPSRRAAYFDARFWLHRTLLNPGLFPVLVLAEATFVHQVTLCASRAAMGLVPTAHSLPERATCLQDCSSAGDSLSLIVIILQLVQAAVTPWQVRVIVFYTFVVWLFLWVNVDNHFKQILLNKKQ